MTKRSINELKRWSSRRKLTKSYSTFKSWRITRPRHKTSDSKEL